MIRIITVDDIKSLLHKVTLKTFFNLLHQQLIDDFTHWQQFHKQYPAIAETTQGVMELMPIYNQHYFAMKYACGYPGNPAINKPNVMAVGLLCDTNTGSPLLISEMTLLTALRTAATSALASHYLARPDSHTFGIIGTGAQAEFQVLAHHALLPIQTVTYFDQDPAAMQKFADNLQTYEFALQAATDAKHAALQADIITTATVAKRPILQAEWLRAGMHINCIGSDAQGKTELAPDILKQVKWVLEYATQSQHKGEWHHIKPSVSYTELWEIVAGKKPGRFHREEITLFDSVGFALEDYSILRLVHRLAEAFHVGHLIDLIPELPDPKNLFSLLR